jgi:hypothetical protein
MSEPVTYFSGRVSMLPEASSSDFPARRHWSEGTGSPSFLPPAEGQATPA